MITSPIRPALDRQAMARRFLDLNQEQRQKFLGLLKNKGIRFELLPIVAADASQHADPVALAPSQKRLWNIYQLEPDNTAYHIVGALNLHGELDPNRLQQALMQVVEQQKLLSSRFIESDDQVWLQPGPADVMLEYHQPLTQQQVTELSDEHAQRRFNLAQQGPLRVMLLRLPAQSSSQQHSQKTSYRLQVVMHHIASDGWSMDLFLSDWVAAYLTPLAVSAPSIQYSDYARWQAAFLDAGERERQLQFWREQLGDSQGHVSQPMRLLPYDKVVGPTALRQAESFQWQLNQSQSEDLHQQAQALQCSSSSLVLAAWQWALAMSAQQSLLEGQGEDPTVSVGLPIAGRYRGETDNLIGFFVNTLVIRTHVNSQQNVRDWVQQIHQRLLAAQDNQTLPFDQLVESLSPKREIGETPLFQVLFNHQVRRQALQIGGQLHIEPVAQSVPHALFDVALDVLEHDQGVHFTLTYAADRYQKSRIEKLQDAVQQALSHLLELSTDSNKTLGQFSLLNPPQQQNWQALSQQTLADYQWDDSQLFTDLVRRQVATQPDAIALVHGSDSDFSNRTQLSYAELESRSNALANLLIRDFNPQADDIIAVCCERGIEMMIGFIATLKAGAAFLPMDPDYPTDRLAYMLSDSGATLVLTQQKLIDESFLNTELPQLALDNIDYPALSNLGIDDSVPAIAIQPQQLAYVIYTSGSTGQPKGVLIPHIGFSMHVQTIGQRYGMTTDDVELLFASISFDGCIERWSVPLAFGSRLVIRDQELWSAEKTCQVLVDEGVTIACLPPSYASVLLDWIELTQLESIQSEKKPPQLKVRSWTLGGEAFTRELYQRLQNVLKPQRLINGYGPTETVITPTLWDAYSDTQIHSAYAPIGTGVGERRLYVLDNNLNPVPEGMWGELYIGEEVGLARGYHQRPDLTAERFLPDPFISSDSAVKNSAQKNSARMYRTGDRVQWTELSDGHTVLDYLGRVDQQIKIRGFRVELGEIEAALHGQAEIADVAVAACLAPPGNDNKKLVAYCTLSNGETLPNWAAISDALAKDLPDYMVPSHYEVMQKLPLNPAGKVDRNALPVPDWQTPKSIDSAEYQAPETAQEIILAKVWGELLLQHLPSVSADNNERQGISRTGNFFALGGDSIIALQVISRLKQLGWNLNPKDIFEHPALNVLAPKLKLNEGDVEAIAEIHYHQRFDLFPIQSHFFSLQPANVDHFNQHVYLQLSEALNIEAFARAFEKILHQHPALACRYQQIDGVWSQQFRQIDQLLLDQLISNHSVNSEADAEALCQQAQRSLNIEQGQLVKVLALSVFNADTHTSQPRLLLVIHHLAVDAVSWRILLQELWQAYLPISQNNSAAALIPLMPTATTASSIAALIKWGHSSEVSKRSDFWQQQLLGDQQLLSKQEYSTEKNSIQALVELNKPLYQQDCETTELVFSTAETQSLLQGAGQLGNQGMMTLLLTALAGALTSLLKNVESSTQATINKRPILVESHGRDNSAFAKQDLSRTVGWYTSLFPLALPVGQSSALQNLESISETLQQANQDLGISYGVLRHLLKDPKLQGIEPQVTFNYLGQYQSELAQAWFTPIKGGGEANDKANPVTTALTINCQISDGCLAMSWQFARDYFDPSQITASQKTYQQALLQVLAELPNSQQPPPPEWPLNPGVSKPTTGMMKLLNQPVMSQAPLFCIHPVTGRTTGYQALAQKLNGQRSLYAIESSSFVSHNCFDSNLKVMAQDYLKMIRECQPTGPYYLLGWSLGGALSMDIAYELEQAGEKVAFIGLIDTYVPGTEVAKDQWQSPSAQGLLRQHLHMLLPTIDDATLEVAMSQLRKHQPQHWPSGFDHWLSQQNIAIADRDNASQMLYAWAVEQNMRQICQGYQLANIKTSVHCWWAAEAKQRGLISGLEQFAQISHQLGAENADHLSIVRDEPIIRDIQARLNTL
jgi:amino acid adenylation domain-containing protein/non-ribosomal peptide synthase protein (TIGR01720 family)